MKFIYLVIQAVGKFQRILLSEYPNSDKIIFDFNILIYKRAIRAHIIYRIKPLITSSY